MDVQVFTRKGQEKDARHWRLSRKKKTGCDATWRTKFVFCASSATSESMSSSKGESFRLT